jgi:molecular chaperone DnaK (HSP70)
MKPSKLRAIGIDLGTTNSAVSEIVWDEGSGLLPAQSMGAAPAPGTGSGSGLNDAPASGASAGSDAHVPPTIRVLEIEQPTREGSYTSPLVPSVVAILPDGRVWVGEGAKRLRAFPTEYGLSFEKNLFYDTKNEMGLRKTYYRAPEAFNHASKIAGKVLQFIAGQAAKMGAGLGGQPSRIAGGDPERTGAEGLAQTADGVTQLVAVTVPASFMLNQRRDTLLAARYAGLRLADDDLLDEPTAALIDYFVSGGLSAEMSSSGGLSPEGSPPCGASFATGAEPTIGSGRKGKAGDKGQIGSGSHLGAALESGSQPLILPADRPALAVVFDFGGGTCDVSVIEISRRTGQPDREEGQFSPAGAIIATDTRSSLKGQRLWEESPGQSENALPVAPFPAPAAAAPAATALAPAAAAPPALLPPALSGLALSQLAVSRYHRLGGGDIDAAIVHEILIPRLMAENKLAPLSLTFAQKKKGLEPQLLGKAEALKIALSSEINRLIKFGRYTPSTDKSSIVVHQPPLTCTLGPSTTYTLSEPSLSAADFERLLAPFLDTDFLFARETEFRLTLSVFAPLRDAMDRASRDASDVDLCLLAGGSTLIPQVRDALRAFFPKARLVFHDDGLEAKLCVSRGAAWNAAFKALTGRPLIQPVLHDGIALITSDGKLNPLIPSGTPLPFPEDGSYLAEPLRVPPTASSPVRELRLEVIGEQDKQQLLDEVWSLPEGVSPGDEIVLEYRLTRGKQFECRAYLAARPSVLLEVTVENPLVNIANPHTTQLKIEKVEEELRQRQGGTARDRDTYVELARMYAELNQREKALDYLRTAQSRISRPDAEILNLQGIYFGELGDDDRATTAFLEADKAEPLWAGPLFNLALSYRRRGRHAEALDIIHEAARHVTVFADPQQKIFEDGAEAGFIFDRLHVTTPQISILGAFRNAVYVAELAAHFIEDGQKRAQFLAQISAAQRVKERPLCFVADSFDREIDRLAEVVRSRQVMNERIGIIVPTNRLLQGIAEGLVERGVTVEKAATKEKAGKIEVTCTFTNLVPKIATFFMAKGLTFDSVLLPRLTTKAYYYINRERLKRMMFVGIARATQWVYLSTVKGTEFDEMAVLREAAAQGHLTMQGSEEWRAGADRGGEGARGEGSRDTGRREPEEDDFSVL